MLKRPDVVLSLLLLSIGIHKKRSRCNISAKSDFLSCSAAKGSQRESQKLLVGAKEFRYEVKIKQCCLLSHVLKVRGTSKLAWFTLTLHI